MQRRTRRDRSCSYPGCSSGRSADTRGTRAFDFLVGPREWPARSTLWQFLANYRHVELKAGDPLDLRAYLESAGPASDETHVRRVVYAVLRRLERERRSVTGPAEKPPDRVRDELIRSPKLQATIRTLSTTKHEDLRELTEKASSMLKKLQAMPDGATIGALAVFLDRVFHRIYAGIDIDREGLERVREATKEGCVILLPSHKSHIDYLVLSYVFNDENISCRSSPPATICRFSARPVFRGRRVLHPPVVQGDRLYSSSSHVREAPHPRRIPLELFIEGARSRREALATQFGMLGMIVESALTVPQRVAYFVPVSIGYERIVETGIRTRALRRQVKEDAAGLLGREKCYATGTAASACNSEPR